MTTHAFLLSIVGEATFSQIVHFARRSKAARTRVFRLAALVRRSAGFLLIALSAYASARRPKQSRAREQQ